MTAKTDGNSPYSSTILTVKLSFMFAAWIRSVPTTPMDSNPDLSDMVLMTAPATIEKFGNAFAGHDALKQAIEDVQVASKSIRVIRDLFEKVATDLETMEHAGIRLHTSLRQYRKRWGGHIEEFDRLLRASREDAAHAAVLISTYHTILREAINRGLGLKELRSEINGFLKRLKRKGKTAEKTADGFRKLAKKINDLKQDIDSDFARLKRAPGELAHRLSSLEAQLKWIQEEPNDLQSRVFPIVMQLAIMAGQAALAILTMSPMTIVPAIRAALDVLQEIIDALYGQERRLAAANRDVTECKKQIAEMEHQRDLLKEYSETFSNAKERIANVVTEIKAVSHFWENLRLDVIKLKDALDVSVNKGATALLFEPKMKLALDIYPALIELYLSYSRIPLE